MIGNDTYVYLNILNSKETFPTKLEITLVLSKVQNYCQQIWCDCLGVPTNYKIVEEFVKFKRNHVCGSVDVSLPTSSEILTCCGVFRSLLPFRLEFLFNLRVERLFYHFRFILFVHPVMKARSQETSYRLHMSSCSCQHYPALWVTFFSLIFKFWRKIL